MAGKSGSCTRQPTCALTNHSLTNLQLIFLRFRNTCNRLLTTNLRPPSKQPLGLSPVLVLPDQPGPLVPVVACGKIATGGLKRISGFTGFYETCKEVRFTRNMPLPTNPGVRWCHPGMDDQPLHKKMSINPKPLNPKTFN